MLFRSSDRNHAVVWRNTIELRKVGDRWIVYDIAFSPKWTLIKTLEGHIAEGARSCVLSVPAHPRAAS